MNKYLAPINNVTNLSLQIPFQASHRGKTPRTHQTMNERKVDDKSSKAASAAITSAATAGILMQKVRTGIFQGKTFAELEAIPLEDLTQSQLDELLRAKINVLLSQEMSKMSLKEVQTLKELKDKYLSLFVPKLDASGNCENKSDAELLQQLNNYDLYVNSRIHNLHSEQNFQEIKGMLTPKRKVNAIDKTTGNAISVTIQPTASYLADYKLMVTGEHNQPLGFAEINLNSEYPEVPGIPQDYLEDSLEVKFLGTSDNKKQIGTRLLQTVVKDSQRMGKGGRVWLQAAVNDLPYEYRSIAGHKMLNTPLPFYYKLGFRFLAPEQNQKVEAALQDFEKTKEYKGPRTGFMFLPEENIEALLKR